MGEAKRKRDRYRKAIENNERWIVIPWHDETAEMYSVSFEYISKAMANYYAELEIYKTVYKDFDVDQIREIEENSEDYPEIIKEVNRVQSESFNRLKSSIREHCAKYGKYEFQLFDEDNEVIVCEELTYRPELDPLKKLP